ncbi:hypothetical protein P1P75_19960 [Streptomyces sp. ID05-39B]|uniref:hypothetical protein n=1 Tax=Streptomyces sp. ID05-39B TaxID=3028664 RepID=UPI0029AD85CB|nr:hypothetical protein [Streptomyces sp. ID05-39B]MDX3528658.1 hypothetical protein [Streptomyces sp. ID05-39B]
MLLLTGICELLALCAGTAVQSRLGVLGLVLLFLLTVAVRARHHTLAAWVTAVLFLLLTAQA